jgi:hypothetical protein
MNSYPSRAAAVGMPATGASHPIKYAEIVRSRRLNEIRV